MKQKVSTKKRRRVGKVKKTHKRALQQWLAPRLVNKPKKRQRKLKQVKKKLKQVKRKLKPTYQRGKGIGVALLGGLIPLIADLIRRA